MLMAVSLPFKSPYILRSLNCIFCDYEASRKQKNKEFKQGLLKLGVNKIRVLFWVNKNYIKPQLL